MTRVRLGAWLPILLYVGAVLVASATLVPSTFGVSDKLVHLLEFAGLAFLVIRGIAQQFGDHDPIGAMAAGLFFTVGVGALDELTQSFAPLRTSDFADLHADAFGALAGTLIGGWVYLRSRANAPPAEPGDPLS